MRIEWDTSYCIGIKSIDDQHKQIVDIINRLIDDASLSVDCETISEMLGQLRIYSREHFRNEESLLMKHNFHDLHLHKEEHMEFRLRLLELCQDTMHKKPSVPDDLIQFVSDWWSDHILSSDMEFKSFLRSQGVS